MKIYCVLLINENTKEIDHCISSDAPINSKMIQQPNDGGKNKIPTIPKVTTFKYRHCYCEFESERFTRSNDILKNINLSKKTNKLSLKSKSNLNNLIETNEHKMHEDYIALVDKEEKERIIKIINEGI